MIAQLDGQHLRVDGRRVNATFRYHPQRLGVETCLDHLPEESSPLTHG